MLLDDLGEDCLEMIIKKAIKHWTVNFANGIGCLNSELRMLTRRTVLRKYGEHTRRYMNAMRLSPQTDRMLFWFCVRSLKSKRYL